MPSIAHLPLVFLLLLSSSLFLLWWWPKEIRNKSEMRFTWICIGLPIFQTSIVLFACFMDVQFCRSEMYYYATTWLSVCTDTTRRMTSKPKCLLVWWLLVKRGSGLVNGYEAKQEKVIMVIHFYFIIHFNSTFLAFVESSLFFSFFSVAKVNEKK